MDTSNKKIAMLSCLVGVLALIYGGTLIFDPERVNNRGASFVWLDPKWVDQADRIELSGSEGDVTLIRKNAVWFVSRDTTEYPAKQLRIQDLLRILSTKGSYPVRGTAEGSHERLGLTPDKASRIVIRGGASVYPLLDLLAGNADATGREIYLRKNGEKEVRSGEDTLTSYIDGRPTGWFNLRLFPEEKHPGLKVESVQRVTVYAPAGDEGVEAPLILSRNQEGWTITGAAVPKVDTQKVESYIRSILEVEGEDFLAGEGGAKEGEIGLPLPLGTIPENNVVEGRILLELGSGQTLTLTVGPLLESNKRSASVEGSPFRYLLPEWTLGRLFRAGSYFEQP